MPDLLQKLTRSAGVLVIGTSLSYSQLATATLTVEKTEALTLEQQRVLYQKTLHSIETKQLENARKDIRKLHGYPLQPYLQVKLMTKSLIQLPYEQIEQFVSQNRKMPITSRLHQSWLSSLAANKNWAGYRKAYELAPVRGNRYKCLNLQAGIKLDQKNNSANSKPLSKGTMVEISGLWQQGFSLPNSCDSVFKLWENQGGLTSDIAETRFWNGIEERNFDIARYAQKKITEKAAKSDADLFWKVREDPKKWLKTSYFQSGNSNHNVTVNYGIRRLSNKSIPLAVERWLALREHLNFAKSTRDSLDRYLSFRLAARFHSQAEELLAKIDPDYLNNEITEWRIRLAMNKQDWLLVSHRVKQLPLDLQYSSRWSYWQAVAQQHMTGERQTDTFARISKERSYYGFLASDQMGLPYSMNYEPANIPVSVRADLLSKPEVQRMKELVFHKELRSARQEWNRYFLRINEKQRYALAYLAQEWQWHLQAIISAAKLKKFNDLELRFPMDYYRLYHRFTQRSKIPLNWALSITRKESAFNRFARSGVGARGLMQLMPKTALETAKYIQQKYSGTKDLNIPETNISLGTAYLAQMRDRFGSRIYATAAYNAGPHRVKKWLKFRGHLPLDIWIELIPFKETRNYVQTVLEYGVVYDVLANLQPKLLQEKEQQLLALSMLEADNKKTNKL
jgi:soluble lytic murein transglycosylase